MIATSSGIQYHAARIVIYGVEKIGKSTLASKFPSPLFIDVEDGTTRLNVRRTTRPISWAMLLDQLREIGINPMSYDAKTIVIDTVDWASMLCEQSVCEKTGTDKIKEIGYGNGYVLFRSEFRLFLESLTDIQKKGCHVVLLAHATQRKVEYPGDDIAFDKWEMKAGKTASELVKEWAEAFLFANFDRLIIKDSITKKGKAISESRMLFAQHAPTFDAGNRFDLPEKMPLEYDSLRHILEQTQAEAVKEDVPRREETVSVVDGSETELPAHLKSLESLMNQSQVSRETIRQVILKRFAGVIPEDTPFENIPENLSQVLERSWEKVTKYIKENNI